MTSVSDIDNRIWLPWSGGIICRGRYFSVARNYIKELPLKSDESIARRADARASARRETRTWDINRGYAEHDLMRSFNLMRSFKREKEREIVVMRDVNPESGARHERVPCEVAYDSISCGTWRDKSQLAFNHADSIRKVCQRVTLALLVERDFLPLAKLY